MTEEDTVRSEGSRSSSLPKRLGWLGYWLLTYSSSAHWDFSCRLSMWAASDRPQASAQAATGRRDKGRGHTVRSADSKVTNSKPFILLFFSFKEQRGKNRNRRKKKRNPPRHASLLLLHYFLPPAPNTNTNKSNSHQAWGAGETGTHLKRQQPLQSLCFSSFTFGLNNVRCWSHVCCTQQPVLHLQGSIFSVVLIKGRISAPSAPGFGVFRSPD